MLTRILLVLAGAFLVLVTILLFNTFRFDSVQIVAESKPAPAMPAEALEHLQQAIRIKTVSHSEAAKFDSSAFKAFHEFLISRYPLIHTQLKREVISGYSLLYTWTGKNDSLKPVILMAHQDVVPVEEDTRNLWTVDPFEGVVRDNYIWGRGVVDDKMNLLSIMEAIEKLLKGNFNPDRTVYLVFGHDEELGGRGAKAVAALLQSRKIRPELVLDEGGIVTREKMPGMTVPVALLGTAEKGNLSLRLTVSIPGGHSSMPAAETSIDVLSAALMRIRAKPFEPKFSQPVKDLLRAVGPEMPFFKKMIFANAWLFKSIIIGQYEKSGPGNAMVRTTAVPTIYNSGIKDNIIPTLASAILNIRLLPGDSSRDIIDQVNRRIADKRVKVEVYRVAMTEGSGVTSVSSDGFKAVAGAVRKSIPGAVVSPFLMIGATDSRHFSALSDGIIRFSPMIDPIAFHGIDERVSLESFQTGLWFYEKLIGSF